MPRGGARPGAGRKPIIPVSKEKREYARVTGATPAEELLALGRCCAALCRDRAPRSGEGAKPVWSEDDKADFKDLARIAADCLGKAAPYYDQKIASVHVIRRVDLERLSDDQLGEIEEIIEGAADAGRNQSGTGQALN